MSGNHRQIWGFPLKIWLIKENDSKYIAVLIKLNAQDLKMVVLIIQGQNSSIVDCRVHQFLKN